MKQAVEVAFAEMLDISTDIDRAMVFGPEGVIVSNVDPALHDLVLAEARQLIALGEESASHMGSQPLTQLVVETGDGLVLLVREVEAGGLAALATARKRSRVGLLLYDLRTCLRDAREAMKAASPAEPISGQEATAQAAESAPAAGEEA